jgi:predicted methyltransferase
MTRTTEARLALAIGAVLLAALVGTRTQAQEADQSRSAEEIQRAQAELDRTPTDCIIISRVDRNVAASNSQVVFFMKGGTYYLNVLDGACQALSKGDEYLVFQYRTRSARLTRLCDSDGFTVERQTSRIGCALGQFFPITAEEAAALTAKAGATPAASKSAND